MSEPEFSAPFNALIEYLDAKNYNYSSYPEENRVSLTMSGYQANYRFTFRITHDGEFLQVTAQYPFFVRNEKLRPTASELLTRANYNLLLGNFEMDMKDGEIRFHVTHLIEEGQLSQVAIDKVYMATLFTMDRYFPALMQHIHAGYTPEDAIFHAELDLNAESVEETKPKKKAAPKDSQKTDSSPRPSSVDPRLASPSAPESTPRNTTSKPQRKPARKKSDGGNAGQDELPL